MNYFEYSTVTDVKNSCAPDTSSTTDDAIILSMVREASRIINDKTRRWFSPVVKTINHDALKDIADGVLLVLEKDCLSITSITNGDATTVSASEYVTEPRNDTPYWAIRLKNSSSKYWTYSTDPENAIAVAAIWGYHDNYTDAWVAAGTIADGAGINASVTTYTASANHGIKAGNLLKIESEFLYASAVSSNTITVVRGVNGSTAATHATATAVSVWTPDYALSELCKKAAVFLYKQRSTPGTETVTIDGETFYVPKDVSKFIERDVYGNGWVRL